jgi:hypothetical protein
MPPTRQRRSRPPPRSSRPPSDGARAATPAQPGSRSSKASAAQTYRRGARSASTLQSRGRPKKRRCDPERRLTPLGASPAPPNLTCINARMPRTIPDGVLQYTPYTAARCPGPSRRGRGRLASVGRKSFFRLSRRVRRVRGEGPAASRLSLDRRGQVVG